MAGGLLGSYERVSVGTGDPAALVVELFDGAQRFLARAQRAIAAGNQADFAHAQSRAVAILAELSNMLNLDEGGDVAQNLYLLYDFMMRHLAEGLAEKSAAHMERVAGMLEPLREGFDAARAR
jgi:flagellar secretion chaperone FliS